MPNGFPGPTGAPGISAPTGPQGFTGRTGTTGPQAFPSAPGYTGDPGASFAYTSQKSAIVWNQNTQAIGASTGQYLQWGGGGTGFYSSNTGYIDTGATGDDAFTIVTSGNYYIQWAFYALQGSSTDISYIGYDYPNGSTPQWNTGGKIYGNTSYHKNVWVMGWAGYIDAGGGQFSSKVMYYMISNTGGNTITNAVTYVMCLD
jgi:hypothetical protein